jgi:hypothetical protein
VRQFAHGNSFRIIIVNVSHFFVLSVARHAFCGSAKIFLNARLISLDQTLLIHRAVRIETEIAAGDAARYRMRTEAFRQALVIN